MMPSAPRGSNPSNVHFPCPFVPGLCLALLLSAPVNGRAEITVTDDWANSRRVFVQDQNSAIVFSQDASAILMFSKDHEGHKPRMRIVPWHTQASEFPKLTRCNALEDAADHVEIDFTFIGKRGPMQGILRLDTDGTMKVTPGPNLTGITIFSDIRYGVLPGRILDDVIYEPESFSGIDRLHLPSERSFLALLAGRDAMFICAWPKGNQNASLLLDRLHSDTGWFKGLELRLDGKSISLRMQSTPGIWHEVQPRPEHLEKDLELDWKRPFEGKWKTHLIEGEPLSIRTAFAFKNKKTRMWRPGGSFTYPAWFEDNKTFLSFSKKVPPEGNVLIYCLEGYKFAPVEFANRSFGDIAALRKRESGIGSVGRPGMRNCDARRYVVQLARRGLQCRETLLMQELMIDFVDNATIYNQRLADYAAFMETMRARLNSWQDQAPDDQALKTFLESMQDSVRNMRTGYDRWMGERTAAELLQYEKETVDQLKPLIAEEGVEAFPESQYLLWECNKSAGKIEIVSGRVGGLAREWARAAAHGCVNSESAVPFAELIREEIRSFIGRDRMCETVY